MKLYITLAVVTASYTMAVTGAQLTNPTEALWNGVIGAMMSLALVLSTVPLAGPQRYQTALRILTTSLPP